MSVVTSIIELTEKETMPKQSLALRSHEVIQLIEKFGDGTTPYAYAFGACWGHMNDTQRQKVLDFVAEKVKEKN